MSRPRAPLPQVCLDVKQPVRAQPELECRAGQTVDGLEQLMGLDQDSYRDTDVGLLPDEPHMME
jgi:hypothetical protein